MKKIPVIALMVVSLLFAGFAEAAKPKKRTRNANRIGAYGGALVGMSSYSGDHLGDEQDLTDFFNQSGTVTNLTTSTDDSDIGYQAAFGYRFTRYFAAELGLAQFGDLTSVARGQIDFNDGTGVHDATLTLGFKAGGPVFSAIGILPINEKFEFYGRLGYLFASSDRTFVPRVDGQASSGGGPRGDSQDVVYGVGFSWHVNQVYSVRAEYQDYGEVGEASRTGTEKLKVASLGLIVRF